jgi:hypothetical protein
LTTWQATDSAKTTRIRCSSDAKLVMDHTAVAGHLVADGRLIDVFGADASVPSRERHYRALYRSWLGDNPPSPPPKTTLLLHDLLLKPFDGAHI